MTVRVLIADDEALVRRGFAMILGAAPEIEVVGEVGTGEEAVVAARRLEPDVVLMDIRMPGSGGIEATRHITATSVTRVVVVTTFGHDEYLYQSLRAGATGFLLKNTPAEQLVESVRIAARGDALLSPEITRRLIEAFARLPSVSDRGRHEFNDLTDRERDVLLSLASGRSNAEIAAELGVSEATVKSHVTSILGKLGVRDRTQAVIAAYEAGIVAPRSPD
jgi:DNA-binding NarL/FixJ family response regulator